MQEERRQSLPEPKQMVDVALSVHRFSSSDIEPKNELTKVESTKVIIEKIDAGTAPSIISLKD